MLDIDENNNDNKMMCADSAAFGSVSSNSNSQCATPKPLAHSMQATDIKLNFDFVAAGADQKLFDTELDQFIHSNTNNQSIAEANSIDINNNDNNEISGVNQQTNDAQVDSNLQNNQKTCLQVGVYF